jgi:prevent-host-death family protein
MVYTHHHESSVGIGALKAKLSSYLEKVRHGEEIIITDHGQEVALLVPISRERKIIQSLVKSGKSQWSGGRPKGIEALAVKGKPLSETILEERE